jgi:D-alanyl-D-alanine carboxypeptidase (penicillin-binding protein 5/6)
MPVIEPKRYQHRTHRHRRWWIYLLTLMLLVVATGAVNYFRPLPASTATLYILPPTTITAKLAWPTTGQAAVGASGYGVLDTFGAQTSLATASIAKVITALCVLQKAPLQVGQTGPTYTVDATDAAIYQNYVAEDGSLLPVQIGEHLTEYQALEALMIPSANNIADSLVRWVFGSQAAYVTYADTFLQQHDISNTHIGSDASGFSPTTTSVASDLTQLGLLAMQNPTLTQIVAQSSAVLPTVGVTKNYDTVLGQAGINGMKTGNNEVDLGAFLFTAAKNIDGQTVRLDGTVMGASSLNAALQESVSLATSFENDFEESKVTRAGESVGTLYTPWGAAAPILSTQSLQLVRWEGTPITLRHHINTSIRTGTIGDLEAIAGPQAAKSSLRLGYPISNPSFLWRLTRR